MLATHMHQKLVFQNPVSLYQGFRQRGLINQAISWISGRSNELKELAMALEDKKVCGQNYAGVGPVPIDRICGSESRPRDFDRDFRPLQERTCERWMRVAAARINGYRLPPVQLIQAGEEFFVRDGHHRISVARALGEEYIDAEIIALNFEPNNLSITERRM